MIEYIGSIWQGRVGGTLDDMKRARSDHSARNQDRRLESLDSSNMIVISGDVHQLDAIRCYTIIACAILCYA